MSVYRTIGPTLVLDYNFSSVIMSGKLTKIAGHFRNLSVLSDRPTVLAKTDDDHHSSTTLLLHSCRFCYDS